MIIPSTDSTIFPQGRPIARDTEHIAACTVAFGRYAITQKSLYFGVGLFPARHTSTPTERNTRAANIIITAGLPNFLRSERFSDNPAFIKYDNKGNLPQLRGNPEDCRVDKVKDIGTYDIPAASIPMIPGSFKRLIISAAEISARKIMPSEKSIKTLLLKKPAVF